MSDFYQYENQERNRGRGAGWMIATLALVAFLGGALLMKYLPGSAPAASPAATPAPTVTATAPAGTPTPMPTPAATLPALGGAVLSPEVAIDIPGVVRLYGPSVVGVLNKVTGRGFGGESGEATQGSGSGVIISDDGYIVTNNHVVAGADSVSVVLAGGKEVKAEVVGADAQTDLAVLKVAEAGLVAIPFGDSDAVQVGETVIAIGNPLGIELSGTVTHGIISAKNRSIQIDGYNFKLLQTDAAINPGNSGGALVNARGQLIGINSSKSTLAGTDNFGNPIAAEGIGFAIPINEARPILEQLIQYGGIARPMIGISRPFDIAKEDAEYWGVPVGVAIRAVMPGGPAEKAGLKAGDIIVEFDGQKVETLNEIRDIMNKRSVGDTVKVKAYRDDTKSEVTVDLVLGSSIDLNKQ